MRGEIVDSIIIDKDDFVLRRRSSAFYAFRAIRVESRTSVTPTWHMPFDSARPTFAQERIVERAGSICRPRFVSGEGRPPARSVLWVSNYHDGPADYGLI